MREGCCPTYSLCGRRRHLGPTTILVLQVLQDTLDALHCGRNGSVIILGEAGMGKTHLVEVLRMLKREHDGYAGHHDHHGSEMGEVRSVRDGVEGRMAIRRKSFLGGRPGRGGGTAFKWGQVKALRRPPCHCTSR